MEGQWKWFDLKTQCAVSLALDQKKLQLGNLWVPVKALPTGTNTSSLHGQTVQKPGNNGHLYVSAWSRLNSYIHEEILTESSSWR